MIPDYALADIFAFLMALSVLVYAILDGYDLGVGLLLPMNNEQHRDKMIASIGPFWDANETWLVLAVGLLLIAFPTAHSYILKALYLPAAVMLIGLILRGVAFDFRAKVRPGRKRTWDHVFKIGSLLATASQGYMLGAYVMGFEQSLGAIIFSLLSAVGVTMAYILIGASWLIMKTEQDLQQRAIRWATRASMVSFVGILAVCVVNPLINEQVMSRWTTAPSAYLFAMIPVLCFMFLTLQVLVLRRLPLANDEGCWLPFVLTTLVFLTCFAGLGVSFYPYVVPGVMTFTEAASAPDSLRFILYGALVVIPCILAYTVFSYRVFWGKVRDLTYY
ncbi:cytochrome d ubiquinol oxidase subunit II [Aestuariibacter halophilus]|uniref:Cytochrome d ubiquinol oxidase subunit II n=1 Tax=Fluctibacter halophilus TaxID=226011 RepID=A0ABS8GCB2_9ALTE|nr:cytochrome d ubiquinol oxidase subunit II [Aestuariibacter halophilus]MCC2617751.1 cytochrome d ubiquinol oxidase subunit II [Aestuariibacter halophilus]